MSNALETVATFGRPEEAGMARGVLASCGIRSFVCEEMAQGMMWHLRPVLGGVRLQVAAQDLEKALAILRELEQPQPPQSFAPDPGEEEDEDEARSEKRRRPSLPPRRAAEVAWRTAVLGLIFLPVLSHMRSLGLVGRALLGWEELDPRARRQLVGALLLDLGVFCLAAVLLWRWIGPMDELPPAG